MTFDYHVGASALLVSMPHVGTKLPDGMTSRMSDEAKRVPDTDWHVDRLYDFLDELGASVLQARFSRYVVDLNRPPDDANLYPGVNTTGLRPTDTFDDEPIYRDVDKPTAEEIAERVDTYWRPYHDQLETALSGIKEQHGYALLWDAHSIRAEVPRLFDGRLPDLNIGTAAVPLAQRNWQRGLRSLPKVPLAIQASSTAASPAASSPDTTAGPATASLPPSSS